MNGKLCVDSSTSVTKLFLKSPSLPVKLFFEEDSLNRPFWVLSKSAINKDNIQYSYLKAGKKNYELKPVEAILKDKAPTCFRISSLKYLIARQEDLTNYRLVLQFPAFEK